jgi:hypothetical protein
MTTPERRSGLRLGVSPPFWLVAHAGEAGERGARMASAKRGTPAWWVQKLVER